MGSRVGTDSFQSTTNDNTKTQLVLSHGSSPLPGDTVIIEAAETSPGTGTTQDFNTPSGWTAPAPSVLDAGTPSLRAALFYKTWASGDTLPTLTWPTPANAQAVVKIRRGYDTTNPFHKIAVAVHAGTGTARTTSSIVTTVDGCTLEYGFADRSGSTFTKGTSTDDTLAGSPLASSVSVASFATPGTIPAGTYTKTATATATTSVGASWIYALLPSSATAPTANAGPDQSVAGGATVTLTGTDSDAVGVTTRTWTQTAGTAVTLTGTGATRTFTAPTSASSTTLTFQYTASNAAGLTASDTVDIIVGPSAVAVTWDGVGFASGTLTTTSAGAGDRPFDAVNGAGQTIAAGNPTRVVQTQSSGVVCFVEWRLTERTTWGMSGYLTTPAVMPSASVSLMSIFTAAGATAARFDLTPSGQVRIRNASAQVGSTSTVSLQPSTRYLIRVKANLATAGNADIEVWNSGGGTLITSLSVTGDFGGTAPWCRFGNVLTSSQLGTVSWSNLVATNTYAFPPKPSSNADPTVVAGGAQTIDPNVVDSFTLSAVATDDSAVASVVWDDVTVAGSPVRVGSAATSSVPLTGLRTTGTVTRTYRATATDDTGLTATATTTVTLLPHTTWTKSGSTLIPVRIMS